MRYIILPNPPNLWSRVQNPITFLSTQIPINQMVTMPLTGKVVPISFVTYETEMLNKGNVLQYKQNSSNLTKKQQYAKMAKGQWIYKKTWATQSENGYTNPNTNGYNRVNYIDIQTAYGQTIQDLGTLQCNSRVNTNNELCFPTTCSDVPGPIANLCWNTTVNSWIPRTRYTMPDNGNKFPVNATLISAVYILPPVLSLTANSETSITLTWTTEDNCLNITSFNVYQNSALYSTVPYPINSITISGLTTGTTYTFYVTNICLTNPTIVESIPSNSVTIS